MANPDIIDEALEVSPELFDNLDKAAAKSGASAVYLTACDGATIELAAACDEDWAYLVEYVARFPNVRLNRIVAGGCDGILLYDANDSMMSIGDGDFDRTLLMEWFED